MFGQFKPGFCCRVLTATKSTEIGRQWPTGGHQIPASVPPVYYSGRERKRKAGTLSWLSETQPIIKKHQDVCPARRMICTTGANKQTRERPANPVGNIAPPTGYGGFCFMETPMTNENPRHKKSWLGWTGRRPGAGRPQRHHSRTVISPGHSV